MQLIPRNKKAIPIIKHFCRKFFLGNIAKFLLFTNTFGECAVICVLNSNHRLVVWYNKFAGKRSLVALAHVDGFSLGVDRKRFETVNQLKKVLVYDFKLFFLNFIIVVCLS